MKTFGTLLAFLFALTAAAAAFAQDAGEYTRYADYAPVRATPAALREGPAGKTLVAYFSRSGNTAVPAGTDAVSSASLRFGDGGETTGNAGQIARWIADETGGDLFLIQTEYTYPLDYRQTVRVGEGQDRDGYRPGLASHIADMARYDTVCLVYPIWHYTLPVAVCSFLDEYDLSGKTVLTFATHAGSRFADTVGRIREAKPGANVIQGVAVGEREIGSAKDAVLAAVRKHVQAARTAQAPGKGKTMKMKIGGAEVAVQWENNESVKALRKLAAVKPLTVPMSMYGGFEQVGSLGTRLPRNDAGTTTRPGDIVLYSGDQIVIFYGSNSWSYTRLGHVAGATAPKMAGLLGNGNVTLTIYME